MQYTAMAKNLIGLKPARKAMLMRTGMWSNQNVDELKKFCNVVIVADIITANDCTKMIPPSEWNIDPEASFFHLCVNETVNGLEFDFDSFPFHLIPKDIPIICDMSSNIATTRVPWDKVGMVYMGAQKNLGAAGCTVMVIREDLIGHHNRDKDVPILCDWDTF